VVVATDDGLGDSQSMRVWGLLFSSYRWRSDCIDPHLGGQRDECAAEITNIHACTGALPVRDSAP